MFRPYGKNCVTKEKAATTSKTVTEYTMSIVVQLTPIVATFKSGDLA